MLSLWIHQWIQESNMYLTKLEQYFDPGDIDS